MKNKLTHTQIKLTSNDALLCPVCGFEYNHEGDTQVCVGDDYTAIPGGFRGKATIIPMTCEQGHKWTLCVQFHKGYQFIYAILGHLKRVVRTEEVI